MCIKLCIVCKFFDLMLGYLYLPDSGVAHCSNLFMLFYSEFKLSKLLQVEVALSNAKAHNPGGSPAQIADIKQIIMAINALSKVFLNISSFLCRVVYPSWFNILFFIWEYFICYLFFCR